jgi:hypothetical protein
MKLVSSLGSCEMDLTPAATMIHEIDRACAMLMCKLTHSAKVEPDERITAAEALLMLQKDRKLLVAEIMTAAYGSKI